MFQRVQKIVKPRADRSMMQTSTVARKLSAACIFAGWWDREKAVTLLAQNSGLMTAC